MSIQPGFYAIFIFLCSMKKSDLCGYNVNEIHNLIQPAGFNYSHALKISNSLYKKRISEFQDISNIPKKLIEFLSAKYSPGFFKPVTSQLSSDRSIKYLFRNSAGLQYETVFIPEGKRNTVCVSVQSGCRMACPFCMTGSYGFRGDIPAGEIINQVLSLPDAGDVTHVVFMGMGEPMDNLDNVLKACEIMTAEWGMALSPRNVTVSTIGVRPGVIRFLQDSECNLTLSLYSPFPDERKRVIPLESRYPAEEMIALLKDIPARKQRRFSVAYIMINGVNDTERHLQKLRDLLQGSKVRVNLIPYHPVPGSSDTASSQERMHYFRHELTMGGVSASVRRSRGADISAACGLLAAGLH